MHEAYAAHVSIRQHTSAYVSVGHIRQDTSGYVSIRERRAYIYIRQHTERLCVAVRSEASSPDTSSFVPSVSLTGIGHGCLSFRVSVTQRLLTLQTRQVCVYVYARERARERVREKGRESERASEREADMQT